MSEPMRALSVRTATAYLAGPWRPMTAPDEPPPVYAWRDRDHAESDAAMFEQSRTVEWKRVSGDAG